jgi:hypothetical protein
MQVLIGYNNPQCSECLNPLVRESYTCKNFGINLEIPFIRLEVKKHAKLLDGGADHG